MSQAYGQSSSHSNTIYASFWERFGALGIDTFILWIAIAFLSNLLHEGPERSFIGVMFSVKGSILQIIVTWLYFALQESSIYQASIGKRAFRLSVVDKQAKRISFLRATVRHFARFISSFLLFIGFLMMLWDPQRRTLHDKIAGTLVVK